MRYFPGLPVVSLALVALAAPASAQTPPPTIHYDSIFYRANAGWSYCYRKEGDVAWSEHPLTLGDLVSHARGAPCVNNQTTAAASAATNECVDTAGNPHICQADCTSYVLKSWQTRMPASPASAQASLNTIGHPGGCSNVDTSAGTDRRIAHVDEQVKVNGKLVSALPGKLINRRSSDLALPLRPGDDCENGGHSTLLVRRVTPLNWITWEAKDSEEGIGQNRRYLPDFVPDMTHDDCHAGIAGCGCWRQPNTVRTGPPTLFSAGNNLNTTDDVVFSFQQPQNFGAIADYLLWLHWDDNEGTGKPPNYQHRLIRIPMHTHRWDPAAQRLADFVANSTVVNNPSDVVGVMRLPLSRLLAAGVQVVRPNLFKDPDGNLPNSASWDSSSTLVPCVGEISSQRHSDDACVPVDDTLPDFVPGKTYSWQMRVERFGFETGGFQRVGIIGGCDVQNSVETDPVCKDPAWSAPSTFSFTPGPPCAVSMSAGQTTPTLCPLGLGTWVIDPSSIAGCLSIPADQCGQSLPAVFGFGLAFQTVDAKGQPGPSGGCGVGIGIDSNTPMGCGAAEIAMQQACSSGTPLCHCQAAPYPWKGPGKLGLLPARPGCSNGASATLTGTMTFTVINCGTPGKQTLPGCN